MEDSPYDALVTIIDAGSLDRLIVGCTKTASHGTAQSEVKGLSEPAEQLGNGGVDAQCLELLELARPQVRILRRPNHGTGW
jgi:hypothetical protein